MIAVDLKKRTIIIDGAMGSYYAKITGKYTELPEYANIEAPEIITGIHKEYISAGAMLIKTNTFSANRFVLKKTKEERKMIIEAAVEIARQAVIAEQVHVAASIGPIPDTIDKQILDKRSQEKEYLDIVDIFIDLGIDIFIFETFGDCFGILGMAKRIRARNEKAFIIAQFALDPEGYTRKGIHAVHLIETVKSSKLFDAYGFNCGVGPGHLYNLLKRMDINDDIISVSPNAGYPEIVNERTVYIENPEYFAQKMSEIESLGVKILGGCCGTTPEHIKWIKLILSQKQTPEFKKRGSDQDIRVFSVDKKIEDFSEKIACHDFFIAVELDPPFDTDVERIIYNAEICRDNGVNLVTIADSPMGRVRIDPMLMAVKIKRETGVECMPHICCRDRNTNALKSLLMAGYVEGIRNVLAVTGDPVAPADKSEIKEVFDLNSLGLIELISNMNREIFSDEPINIAAALNLNVPQPQAELSRMYKKVTHGARRFYTQPIFDPQKLAFLPEMQEKKDFKIIGGIMPLVSYRNAQFLNNEIPGIKIPENTIKRFDPQMSREYAEELGVEIALEIAEKMRGRVKGFYFITPFNRVEMIVKIIRRLTF